VHVNETLRERNMKNSEREIPAKDSHVLKETIRRRAKNGAISCLEAMQIAEELGESPLAVGRMLDALEIHLGGCQLGILGCINPQNKTVQAAPAVAPELEEEIRKALQRECLSCAKAWLIAQERNISSMAVSAACECLKIRIKPCQFGIF